MHIVTWHLYPYHNIENPELCNWNIHLKSSREEYWITVSYRPYGRTVMAKPTLRIERAYFNHLECSYIQGMHIIINWVYRTEPRSPGGNTSSKPKALALIHRPTFNRMERMCQHHASNYPALVQNASGNQFIHYYITTETEMLSFWWNFNHWLHRKLSFWHFRCSQWWRFDQNEDISVSVTCAV